MTPRRRRPLWWRPADTETGGNAMTTANNGSGKCCEARAARYCVTLLAEEYDGHKGVRFSLFHAGGLDPVVYGSWVLPGADPEDPCVRGYVDHTFDASEVALLRDYFGGPAEGVR